MSSAAIDIAMSAPKVSAIMRARSVPRCNVSSKVDKEKLRNCCLVVLDVTCA